MNSMVLILSLRSKTISLFTNTFSINKIISYNPYQYYLVTLNLLFDLDGDNYIESVVKMLDQILEH